MNRALLIIAAVAASACTHRLPTHTIRVDGHAVKVEVASDAEQRAQGLMHRDSLGVDEGMLFVYEDTRLRSFWMKDTRIPLSIAFADDTGKILRIADMKPLTTKHTSSIYPARYALEMNQGWFDDKGVDKGSMITDLPPSKEE